SFQCSRDLRDLHSFPTRRSSDLPGALRATWMFLQVSVQLNIWLAVFNMLPLPPLDGSKVLMGILPRRYAYRYARLESYGTVILLLLVVSGMLFRVLQPAYSAVARLVVG